MLCWERRGAGREQGGHFDPDPESWRRRLGEGFYYRFVRADSESIERFGSEEWSVAVTGRGFVVTGSGEHSMLVVSEV